MAYGESLWKSATHKSNCACRKVPGAGEGGERMDNELEPGPGEGLGKELWTTVEPDTVKN